MTRRIGLLLFDDVDLLDVGGPYEVFLTAGRLCEREGEPSPFEVIVIATTPAAQTAYGGMGLLATHTVEEAGRLDIVVIPGAVEIDDVAARPAIRDAVRVLTANATIAASVCTGAFLLGDAGLLADVGWTTHWEDIESLSERVGSDRGVGAQWVDAGTVVTGGGLSNGLAMALHLVDRLAGRDLAIRTARQIDYPWDPGAGATGDDERMRPS